MKTLFRACALAALMSGAALATAQAQTPAPVAADSMFAANTLSLSAFGEVRIAPDMATINIGVNNEAATAAQAMAQNAAQMNRVIAALRAQGIAERDIQTSNLNLSPQYTYRDNEAPLLRGYQANNQVTVRVMDLTRLGQSLDAVVSAGSNQINGVSFGLKDPTTAENQARQAAVAALKSKADLYAAATSQRVVRLVNLSEGGGYTPQPPVPMPMARMAMAADAGTPVSGGELAVRIDISGIYETR